MAFGKVNLTREIAPVELPLFELAIWRDTVPEASPIVILLDEVVGVKRRAA